MKRTLALRAVSSTMSIRRKFMFALSASALLAAQAPRAHYLHGKASDPAGRPSGAELSRQACSLLSATMMSWMYSSCSAEVSALNSSRESHLMEVTEETSWLLWFRSGVGVSRVFSPKTDCGDDKWQDQEKEK